MKRGGILLIFIFILVLGSISALPIFPGAEGYGIGTPAGRGGTIMKVTNLNPSGSGSLKGCLDAIGPRICVFEVSGVINITTPISNSFSFLFPSNTQNN